MQTMKRYAPYRVHVTCEVCREDIGAILHVREARLSIHSIVQEHETMTLHNARCQEVPRRRAKRSVPK
jgi:hypothetical protein